MNKNNNKNIKKSNAPTTIYSTNNKNKPSNKAFFTNARTKIYTPNTKNSDDN